jgi:predicted thioredoxin/glutaredoxin
VPGDRSLIDIQEPKAVQVMDPHRQRIDLEELVEATLEARMASSAALRSVMSSQAR